MGRIDNPTASTGDREYSINQLSKIGGISRKTAEAFYEMGIHTYADLAKYLRQHTAEEVSAALKGYGLNRPPGLINLPELTRQAEMLSQEESQEQAKKKPPAGGKSESELVPGVGNLGGAPHGREPRDHAAIFTVSFDVIQGDDGSPVLQTTVYDEKDHGEEQRFLGSDSSPWVNWMLKRANLSEFTAGLPAGLEQAETEALPPAEAEVVLSGVPAEPYQAQLTITSLQLTPIKPTASAPGKNLKAELSFQLSGADAPMLASHAVPYRISIYTIEYGKGTPAQVGSLDGHLAPKQFEYAHRLEFTEPEAGRYDLHSVVRLPPSGKLMGYYQGPVIMVGT